VLLWLFPIVIARKVRMLHMGLPLGSPVQTKMKAAYGLWIGVQLICQLVVAYFKGCATPGTPSYTAWAATEMLYLLVYCSPAALAYIYTLWVCRWIRLHDDDENNARLYEQFIEVRPSGNEPATTGLTAAISHGRESITCVDSSLRRLRFSRCPHCSSRGSASACR